MNLYDCLRRTWSKTSQGIYRQPLRNFKLIDNVHYERNTIKITPIFLDTSLLVSDKTRSMYGNPEKENQRLYILKADSMGYFGSVFRRTVNSLLEQSTYVLIHTYYNVGDALDIM